MKTLPGWALGCALVLFCLLAGAYIVPSITPVQAAPATDGVDGCTPIGTAGNSIMISRCVDEMDGTVLYVNNVGMIVVMAD